MSATSSRSVSRSGTPLGTRPHSITTAATSSSSLSEPRLNNNNSNSNYFSYPVSRVVSGLYRRFTEPPQKTSGNNNHNANNNTMNPTSSSLYTPQRTASPFQPPPLTPLTLKSSSTTTSSLHPPILSRALAEEIRLLIPPRLQLIDTWHLAYSLERDGASLGTLYEHCKHVAEHNPRAGYVLVVRDTVDGGAVFGAYLTDAPHPASHFYGTGECFLWRASVLGDGQGIWNDLYNNPKDNDNRNENGQGYDEIGGQTMTDEQLRRAGFPPPPSADTTNAVRSTTLRASTPTSTSQQKTTTSNNINNSNSNNLLPLPQTKANISSGTSTPERIRFKAFPYSGINDYMMFCETGFLSVGGGDGHYGLWIDDSVEKGVSDSCPTFGNEPLSDDGTKFDILGVEIWYIGT
ncbi:oxidative stress response protein Oxr1, putative [Talaromyces stipitatus ATCC 10500]|uniref:Oxidation resistance protein 1 n=1 Tax=Talaromyces stipitatus (strain ATCC 10500 / CBS 375.48 / QM 6759 / NRRL 1006) TaxID=441959 RepID=B8MTA1_TALSN|nr:oxidative stress response protein Oxr1, putative [Talaromyces stipitatus ATCC 10500]EED12383.1 oxidative stress response protein Oxr1, putative [Talaromyces stipitatus ATCC 10500]